MGTYFKINVTATDDCGDTSALEDVVNVLHPRAMKVWVTVLMEILPDTTTMVGMTILRRLQEIPVPKVARMSSS